ncbi:MAG: hypothetical protein JWL88_820 [Parcubacteria group bacterium]|nr:hypothetical protein [Parcubacteria group bacterium]
MKLRENLLAVLLFLAFVSLPLATHAAITRSLYVGTTGNDVLELQETLRAKGFFTYPVSTGFFGAVTKQAVLKYQAARGLEQVGIVGPLTRSLLNSGGGGTVASSGGSSSAGTAETSANMPAPSVSSGGSSATNIGTAITSSLELGDTGTEVVILQSLLQSHGFLAATPNGTFDSNTVSAVIAFQTANHLETVGRVGPQTRALINHLRVTSTETSGSAAIPNPVSSPGSSGTVSGGSTGSSVTSASPSPDVRGSGTSGAITTGTAVPSVQQVPLLSFTTSTSTVAGNGSVTFAWSSTNASSCAASDGWNGAKATSGTQLITSISRTQTYTMTCSGSGGSATRSLTVSVSIPIPVVQPVNVSTSTISSNHSTLSGNYPVYQGCEAPSIAYVRTIYFDPSNGNDATGDGSQARPFKSVNAFSAAHKILPGDHLILMPGDNGYLTINAASSGALQASTQWTWIDFQPGATMRDLEITASHVIITKPEMTGGLNAYWLININGGDNIVIADGSLYSTKDTSAWTINDWVNTVTSGIQINRTICTSIIRNDIENVRGGIFVSTAPGRVIGNSDVLKSLIQDNLFKWVSSDAIRPIGSYIKIENNRILGDIGAQSDGDPSHDDGIQMYALGGATYHDVIIDHNWIQDEIASNTKWQAAWQGIDSFDGVYSNVQVTNNVVLVGSYHGISMYGLRDSVVANNVYANDMNNGIGGWIALDIGKTPDTVPYGSIAKNNVSLSFTISPVAVNHNNYRIADMSTAFKTFDVANHVFDFHPLPGGPIDGKGAGPFPSGTASGDNTGPTSTGVGTVPTCTLRASPISMRQEESSVLTLSSTDATSATIDNGVGTVKVNSTVSVSPLEITVYTATVTGPGGTNTCFAQVSTSPAVHAAVPPANTAGPVLQYTFDTATITNHVVRSTTPYNYYGTLENGASIASGHSNQALLNSTSTQVMGTDFVIPSALGITNALTISAWVNATAPQQRFEYVFVHAYGNRFPQTDSFSLASNAYGAGPRLKFSDGMNEIIVTRPQSTWIPNGQWTHIAGVLSGTTGYLYINGTLVASSTNAAFKGINQVSEPIGIGNQPTYPQGAFIGLIDDAALYNRALSPAEISALATPAIGMAPSGTAALAPFTHQLALGSTGTEVSALQSVLQSLGLYMYPSVTGYLGQATKNAITAFQKQNQLAAVGETGPQTRSLLNSIAASLHLSR